MTYKAAVLDGLRLSEEFQQVLEACKARGAPASGLRANDFRRWSYVLDMIRRGYDDLLDIGIGMGQFPAAASRSGILRVRGADYKPHSNLMFTDEFEFVQHDLTSPSPEELRAEVVTCMECIEHIPNSGFAKAVQNLKALAKRRLIVTVPYEEPTPLPSYHKQRFTARRLEELFPGSEITIFMAGRQAHWAMVDYAVQ